MKFYSNSYVITMLNQQLNTNNLSAIIFTLNQLSKDQRFIGWLTSQGSYHNRMGIYVKMIEYFLSGSVNFMHYSTTKLFNCRSLLNHLIDLEYLSKPELYN